MRNWLKWKVMWCIIVVVVCYVCFKKWCKEKLLHHVAFYFRLVVVIEFILIACCLPCKYNERIRNNFYFDCVYLVMMVVLLIMTNKFMVALEEDKNGNTTS